MTGQVNHKRDEGGGLLSKLHVPVSNARLVAGPESTLRCDLGCGMHAQCANGGCENGGLVVFLAMLLSRGARQPVSP